jgi:dTDP-4-dehydrorhamnose reductase
MIRPSLSEAGSGLRSMLVLGGTGMLGHVVYQECSRRFDAHATVRSDELSEVAAAALDADRTITGVHAEDISTVEVSGAEVVVNCIGVVKQLTSTIGPAEMIHANALFPHQLAEICAERGVRLIHVSTDCVFSGRRGGYTEDDTPDPEDTYGRSKVLGEPAVPGVLNLRTSMIGFELESSRGLLEWLLAQSGEVHGFTEARFTGPTVPVVAETIAEIVEHHPGLEGTWNLGAEPISKHDLVVLLRDAFELDLKVVPDDRVKVDRTLDSSRFRAATGWTAAGWPEMVAELEGSRAGRPGSRWPVAGR